MPVLGFDPIPVQGLASATFPLALPDLPAPAKIKITPHATVGASRSPYTGSRQTFEWPGDYLVATIDLPPCNQRLARAWCAFLALCRGQSGTFLLGDSSLPFPQGSFLGAPVVDGAQSAGAKTLNLKNFVPNAKKVARSGDWLQLGSGLTQRLYMNLLDVDSDGTGKATLHIFPRLRAEGIANNAAVVSNKPQGVFALAGNDPSYEVDDSLIYGISLDAVEAI